jgi:hypothetical protein
MIKFCVGQDFFDSCKELMRVEFSLCRDVLKDFGIHSVENLLECENSLVRYLCEKWFRVLSLPKDNNGHTSHQVFADWWFIVRDEFLKWFPGVEGHGATELVRLSSRQIDSLCCSPDHLDKQAIGCLATSFTMRFGVRASSDFYDLAVRWFQDNFPKIYERYRERCEILSVAKIKQSEIEGESYDEALDPRVVNELYTRLRSCDFLD